MRRTPDKDCEFCGGEGTIPSMEQVYAGEPHYADVGEEDCICTITSRYPEFPDEAELDERGKEVMKSLRGRIKCPYGNEECPKCYK